MDIEGLIILLIVGAIAGFLAGLIVRGYGFGTVGNIIVGIVGAFLGGVIFPRLGIFTGADLIGQIIGATLGAVILLVIIGFLRRA